MQSDYKNPMRDFPNGPVDKNLPSNAGDKGLIPGGGTKIPHALGQLCLCAETNNPMCSRAPATTREANGPQERACMLQLRPNEAK